MSDFQISDYILQTECMDLAAEIFAEFERDNGPDFDPDRFRDEMFDRAHEYADGHEWVIYTYKARQLCAHCNTDQGEQFLEDVGLPETPTYDNLGTMIAYGEMRARIEQELDEFIADYDPDAENDDA